MFPENDRYLWDRSGADEEVARLERLLGPLAYTPRPLVLRPPAPSRQMRWRRKAIASLATAATLTSLVLGAAVYRFTWQDGQPWEGYVVAAGKQGREVALAPGDILRTGPDATAVVDIARIGTLTVLPGSVVEMVETRTGQHRVELRRGGVLARVWAPPRHFGVSLGSTQAVDLGCEFELRREPGGPAVLRVHSGWVHLQGEMEAVVPAGAVAVVDPEHGPGTPYRAGVHAAVRAALASIDARRGAVLPAGPEVRSVISATGPADAITLVSLLQRYPHLARGPLFAHTHTMLPTVAMPDRARVAAGDTKALEGWWKALPYPTAKRWWLHWRDALGPGPAQAVDRGS
jgi:hypothetical protein